MSKPLKHSLTGGRCTLTFEEVSVLENATQASNANAADANYSRIAQKVYSRSDPASVVAIRSRYFTRHSVLMVR